MDQDKIKALAVLLDVDPEQLVAALSGGDKKEEPTGTEGFYFNPDVFRKLHSIDCEGLRKLVVPDIRRLRR